MILERIDRRLKIRDRRDLGGDERVEISHEESKGWRGGKIGERERTVHNYNGSSLQYKLLQCYIIMDINSANSEICLGICIGKICIFLLRIN